MAAYLITRAAVSDAEGYKAYAGQTVAIAEKFGGEFLVKGGAFEQIEGIGPDRHVVVKFPDRAAARAFYNSPEYKAVLPIAEKCSTRDMVLVDGV